MIICERRHDGGRSFRRPNVIDESKRRTAENVPSSPVEPLRG